MKNVQKYARKPDGKVGNLQSREIKDASIRQECKLSVKSGLIEPKMSNYLPHFPSHTLQA